MESTHQATAEMFAEMAQYQTKALLNLSTATQVDCQACITLTENNATLTKALRFMNEKLIKANAEITRLKANTLQSNPRRLDPVGYC